MRARHAALALLLALTGCGDLPQPFRGNPGAAARLLVAPPAYRIAILPPPAAQLSEAAAEAFATALADALEAADVPAVPGPAAPLDLRLSVVAEREAGSIVPRYALADADGRPLGAAAGLPVAVRDWARADSALLRQVAERDAAKITGLLVRADAARRATSPAALAAGGPPQLRFTGVSGAPGDGNTALATRMRDFLTQRGIVVQEVADGAGYALSGEVAMAPAPSVGGRAQQRVEVVWTVTRRDGFELGRVAQLNEVPAGRLNRLWGDIAYAVAEQAAGGVRDVLENGGGFAAAPAATGATGATAPGR